jgi:hypothetical protein
MRQLTEADVAAAPLPPGRVKDAWGSYLALWRQGTRTGALAAADRFVELARRMLRDATED